MRRDRLLNGFATSARNSTHHSTANLIYAACAARILIVKPTAVVLYVNRMVYTKEFTMGASIICAQSVVEVAYL